MLYFKQQGRDDGKLVVTDVDSVLTLTYWRGNRVIARFPLPTNDVNALETEIRCHRLTRTNPNDKGAKKP